MTNPFLKLMQLSNDEVKDSDPMAHHQHRERLPHEVLRNALDKHHKYKSFVCFGSSRPRNTSIGVGMARLQFGDGEYAQSVGEFQRLTPSNNVRMKRLPEIEEPVPLTRTLMRTPAASSQLPSARSSISGINGSSTSGSTLSGNISIVSGNNAMSVLSPAASTTSSFSPVQTSRQSVGFRDSGSNLAETLSAAAGHGGGDKIPTEPWKALEARPPMAEIDGSCRDLGASWPRPASRRSLGSYGLTSAASRAVSFSGEPNTAADGGSSSDDGDSSPKRRQSLPPPELAAIMSLQQQLQQRLSLLSSGSAPPFSPRESSGADRPPSRALPYQQTLQTQRPFPPSSPAPQLQSPLLLQQLQQQQHLLSIGSETPTHTGYALPPYAVKVPNGAPGCGGSLGTAHSGSQLSPHSKSMPQSPGRVQFTVTGGTINEDLPKYKRNAITIVNGNIPMQQQGQELQASTPRRSESAGNSDLLMAGQVQRASDILRRATSDRGGGGGGGGLRLSTTARESWAQGSPRTDCSVNGKTSLRSGDGDGGSGANGLQQDSLPPRLMTAAEIAVINEAARRYNLTNAEERYQQAGADILTIMPPPVAPPPSLLTKSLSFRRTDGATSSPVTFDADAIAAAATERADGLLRALRSTDSISGVRTSRRSLCKHDLLQPGDVSDGAGGDGPLSPRPPPISSGKGSNSFRRSSSIRNRSSSQIIVDPSTPVAVAADTVTGVVEENRPRSNGSQGIGHVSQRQRSVRLVDTTVLESSMSVAPLSSSMQFLGAYFGNDAENTGAEVLSSSEEELGPMNPREHSCGSGPGSNADEDSCDDDYDNDRQGSQRPDADSPTSLPTTATTFPGLGGGGALRGWSSRKDLASQPFGGSKVRRSATEDLTTVQHFSKDSKGSDSSRDEGPSGTKQLPMMHRASCRLSVSGSTAAALAAAVGQISQDLAERATRGGRASACANDDYDYDGVSSNGSWDRDTNVGTGRSDASPSRAARSGLPPGLYQLMHMGRLGADIRTLLKGGDKLKMIKKFKQAEEVAVSMKMKEQGWRKC